MIDDEKYGVIFPVRTGAAIGASGERKMLAKFGSAEGIRTAYQSNLDGSITRMQTRNGHVEFITTKKEIAAAIEQMDRGFVAHPIGSSNAMLFEHDTLNIENQKYKIHGSSYSVVPFATTFNVTDDSLLNDTISFHKGSVLVNAKVMPVLGVTSGVPTDDALPWLIPHTPVSTPIEAYGDADTNQTVNRVFSVGRTQVKSLGSVDSVSLDLTQAQPRLDRKALSCGQAIVRSTNVAHMSQLWFSAGSWDSFFSAWVLSSTSVSMALSAPYLEEVSRNWATEHFPKPPSMAGTLSGTTTASYTLPEVELWIVGVGETGSGGDGILRVDFPWRYTEKRGVSGKLITAVSGIEQASEGGVAIEVGDKVVVTDFFTQVRDTSATESYGFDAFTIDIPPVSSVSRGGDAGLYNKNTGVTTWDGDSTTLNTVPRGSPEYFHDAGSLPNSANYTRHEQNGSFSVSVGSHDLVTGVFSIVEESGNTLIPSAIQNRYATALADPYGWIGSSYDFGAASRVTLTISVLGGDGEGVPEGAYTEALQARADSKYVGGLYFDEWAGDNTSALYSTTVVPRQTIDNKHLVWETRDFVLFDEGEGAYIYVLSNFVGSSEAGLASGELTVKVVVESRQGTAQIQIFNGALSFSELLPEETAPGGARYVPLPKLSAMFTPKYREQGNFPGAVYTTTAEELSGATPACLVNFALQLKTYSFVGADDDGPYINFVPCNLLEMLYAYVFSQKYGIDDVQRYPVDHAANYTAVMIGLFNQPHHVAYRDGVMVDWLDTFGGLYESETTTELSRI